GGRAPGEPARPDTRRSRALLAHVLLTHRHKVLWKTRTAPANNGPPAPDPPLRGRWSLAWTRKSLEEHFLHPGTTRSAMAPSLARSHFPWTIRRPGIRGIGVAV